MRWRDAPRFGAQAALYAAFAAFIGYLSTQPSFSLLKPDEGLLRLSFLAPGKPRFECRQRTAEELAKLPPQMRAQTECPRERSPIRVRVELDGALLIDESFRPFGLARDGAAAGYRRLALPAGTHQLRVQVNDDARTAGFTHEKAQTVRVTPGQIVLIDFNPEKGGVLIR
jgi:hypothetical protein